MRRPFWSRMKILFFFFLQMIHPFILFILLLFISSLFQIQVVTFATEHNWDSLDFFDGVDGNAPRLGSYSGKNGHGLRLTFNQTSPGTSYLRSRGRRWWIRWHLVCPLKVISKICRVFSHSEENKLLCMHAVLTSAGGCLQIHPPLLPFTHSAGRVTFIQRWCKSTQGLVSQKHLCAMIICVTLQPFRLQLFEY